ncbi:MAG: threonine synthase [Gaiellales bacterium]|nr:threonine synthase [Gaiellales bacterium]
MSTITYLDTRGLDQSEPPFTHVVIEGIAPGGGLFVPRHLPTLGMDQITSLAQLPYSRRAALIHSVVGVDIPEDRLNALTALAFGSNFDHEAVAPVVEPSPGMHVLELWHGPTSAFKDMALQCMPLLFSESIAIRRAAGEALDDYLVLVATSGDTGKAALEGFADRANTSIVVFYPADGVSDIQQKQMVTQRGANLAVFGARGNFDDCQNAVKAVFNDTAFNAELHDRHRLKLSSANSINWGRLVPQIAYYFSAYADMVATGAAVAGHPIDVCVPTGNFGNILACFYARRMGVPVRRLLCASNENNVLTDFIRTGVYDISTRPFVTTPSPSMDILISSNLERLLYELCRDPERVASWMHNLTTFKRFEIDPATFAQVQEEFEGDFVTNDESLETIRRVFSETGYLLDPHTSVAWETAVRHRRELPILIASTAHWAKFGIDVYKALNGIRYHDVLPPHAAGMSGLDLLDEVSRMTGGLSIPRNLSELRQLPARFTHVVDATAAGARGALREWLSSRA